MALALGALARFLSLDPRFQVMRWAAVGPDLFKLDFDLSNEERASQGLSGKAAGLYKRVGGAYPRARGAARESVEDLLCGFVPVSGDGTPRELWRKEIIAAPICW